MGPLRRWVTMVNYVSIGASASVSVSVVSSPGGLLWGLNRIAPAIHQVLQ